MNGTRGAGDRPDSSMDTDRPKVSQAKTKEQIDGDLGRIWVRQMLGRNRGEDRQWKHTMADALLDERLAAKA